MASAEERENEIDTVPASTEVTEYPQKGILVLEPSGRIVSQSIDCVRMLGQSIDSVTEGSADSEGDPRTKILEAIERARRIWRSTTQIVTLERQHLHYFLVRTEIEKARGGAEKMEVWVLDLTEMLHAVDVAGEMRRQLRHDLRGPLTSLNGAVDLLRSGRVGSLEARQARLLDLMDRSVQKMRELIAGARSEPSPANSGAR